MPRQARQTRQQLVCVLADNSGSMAGEKAQAATQGIREMIMECQSGGRPAPRPSVPTIARRPRTRMLSAIFLALAVIIGLVTWRALSSPRGPRVTTTNTIGMKMVLIPAGEFEMGSPDGQGGSDEHPRHHVRITKPFWLGVYKVTFRQYRQFAEETKAPNTEWKTVFPSQSDDHPVVRVSWEDATAFCNWLSAKEGKTYRLPTEAEWEYACRAGSTTKYCFGDNEADLDAYAWYDKNSGITTHPVGKKKPNAWGLYDVHGNAWEWCEDWFDSTFYGKSPADDPNCAVRSANKPVVSPECLRVLRGNSWGGSAVYLRAAGRGRNVPGDRSQYYGFRAARTP